MAGQRGFTLIEVLAAMAVLALTLGAILAATANYASNAAHLQDRMIAGWVAHNEMASASLQPDWPPIGRSNGRVDMARRTWYWEREVEETPDEDIRRVTVRVRDDANEEGWLVLLKGFFGRQHADAAVPPGQVPGGDRFNPRGRGG